MKIPTNRYNRGKLIQLTREEHFQHLVLKSSILKYTELEEPSDLSVVAKKEKGMRFVFLDKITDPQNFGAVLRSAFFLGIDGVLVNKKSRIPLSPAVSKVSAGALEMMDVFCLHNSPLFLHNAKSNFKIIAVDRDLQKYPDHVEISGFSPESEDNIILVFGSEGKGIGEEISKNCDMAVFIQPGTDNAHFPHSLVDSLNVAVTAVIFLNKLKSN